jgi:hypothetical protein
MPRFLWRRLPRAGKVLVVAVAVGIAVTAALAAPGIRDSIRDDEAQERREAADRRERRIAELRKLVRPRVTRVAAGETAALADLRGGIARDARRRTGDRIRRVDCERVPAAPGSRGGGTRLSCLAVTADFARSAVTVGGSIGHPYRAVVDPSARRATYCRVFGVPGEGGLSAKQVVTTPRACGG